MRLKIGWVLKVPDLHLPGGILFWILPEIMSVLIYVKCIELCYITYKNVNYRYTRVKQDKCSNNVRSECLQIEFLCGKIF